MAERALLGALLRAPERITTVTPWLAARDFADATHQAVFTTIRELVAAGELTPATAQTIGGSGRQNWGAELALANTLRAVSDAVRSTRFEHTPGASTTSMTELHLWAAETGTDQHLRYAQMVLEMSVRRQLERWGLSIGQAAVREVDGPDALTVLPRTRRAMIDNLTELAQQLGQSRGGILERLPTAPAAAPDLASAPPEPLPHKLVQRAEREVLRAALTEPQWRPDGLLNRLQPEDFTTTPAHQNTWRALRAVAARGDRIDPVVVAWECEAGGTAVRRGGPNYQAMTPLELFALGVEKDGNVERALSIMVRASLTAHARAAEQEIRRTAADRRQDVMKALRNADNAGAGLEQHAHRLLGAGSHPEGSHIAQVLNGDRASRGPTPPPARPR